MVSIIVTPRPGTGWLAWAAIGLAMLVLLYASFVLYAAAQPVLAVLVLALSVAFAIIFGSPRYYAARFIYPGVAAVLLFVAFPVLYTIGLGFTNYSSFNLLTYPRAAEVLLSGRVIDPATERPFQLVTDGAAYRILLPDEGFLSDPTPLDGTPAKVPASPVTGAPPEPMAMKDVVTLRAPLAAISVVLPDGSELRVAGLRSFASMAPEYERIDADTLRRVTDDAVLRADQAKGFFVTEAGETVAPGWRVGIGFDNYRQLFTSEGVRGPMLQIFLWTVVFALASVALTFALGLTLAVILQWPHLSFKPLYRVLLILPYAVPSFISILVFRGLFNQNFGEINVILQALFGIRPNWFTEAGLARSMIIVVNTWLGYPYMMLLAMGFLQSVPEDLKKAAALEGAGPLRVFFSITLPQIIPPFVPLLIASFAFNFNNIVLILLLTRGAPDIPGTLIPAGQTDILGSFTFRMSFMDTGQQFGLAGAITFLIFIVVAALAYANFIAMRRAANRHRYRP